jgi:hypothetical protein
MVRGEALEPVIWADIERFFKDPGDVLDDLAQERHGGSAIAEAESITIGRALEAIDRQESRAVSLVVRDTWSETALWPEFDRIAAERARLEARLGALETPGAPELPRLGPRAPWTDITYLPTRARFLDLATIVDSSAPGQGPTSASASVDPRLPVRSAQSCQPGRQRDGSSQACRQERMIPHPIEHSINVPGHTSTPSLRLGRNGHPGDDRGCRICDRNPVVSPPRRIAPHDGTERPSPAAGRTRDARYRFEWTWDRVDRAGHNASSAHDRTGHERSQSSGHKADRKP